MSDLLELLKIIIPTIAILVVVYIIMREFSKQNSKQFDHMRNEQQLLIKRMDNERVESSLKISMPLKIQANERMVLFLERINPPNLLIRVKKPKITVSAFHTLLLATIRDEYEHNMSQQLYISNNTWELVKTAKEDVVRLINSTAAKFNPDDDAGKFAQDIITDGFNSSNNPIDKALISLKEDVRENFA